MKEDPNERREREFDAITFLLAGVLSAIILGAVGYGIQVLKGGDGHSAPGARVANAGADRPSAARSQPHNHRLAVTPPDFRRSNRICSGWEPIPARLVYVPENEEVNHDRFTAQEEWNRGSLSGKPNGSRRSNENSSPGSDGWMKLSARSPRGTRRSRHDRAGRVPREGGVGSGEPPP